MAEKKYTEHLGLTQQSEEDFVDGLEISRSFKVLDQEVFSIREKTNNLKNEDHYYSNDYYTFPEKINSITYGEGKYVAAGEYNIYSSVDKRSWNISESRSGISVAYGNGKYMAVVLHNGYYYLLASSDGTEWSEIQILVDGAQSTRKLNEIIYENEKFIIIGDGGKIYTSDGTQITEQNSNTSIDIKSITYGNGIFLAVGYKSTTSVLLKSVDAVTWEQIPLSLQFARNPYDKITFGNGVFVIKDSRKVYTTTDGIDLAAWSTPKPPTNGEICFADDEFFLSCKSGNFISKNGTEWIDIAKEFAGKISAIKYIKDEILGTTDTNKLIGVSKYTIDGIREDVDKLNSALDNATKAISKCDLICTIEKLTNNVVKEFPAKWQDYYFISICYGNYGNIFNSILIPSYYLETTTESTRVIVNSNGDNACSIYKKDASTLYARTGNWIDPNGKIRVYGIMKK